MKQLQSAVTCTYGMYGRCGGHHLGSRTLCTPEKCALRELGLAHEELV